MTPFKATAQAHLNIALAALRRSSRLAIAP